MYLPTESAPPGHFCITVSPLLESGHEIFHSSSFSGKHIVGSVEYYFTYYMCVLLSLLILNNPCLFKCVLGKEYNILTWICW